MYIAFKNEELIQDIINFTALYLDDFVDEISDRKLDWNNENTRLFFELAEKKHKSKKALTLALILYVTDELLYSEYYESVKDFESASYEEFMKEIVLHDIYNSSRPNFSHIKRLFKELNIKKGLSSIDSAYSKTKDEIKLQQFESNLQKDKVKQAVSVEEQIKNEAYYEMIDEKINQEVSVNPEGYLIVGKDYSRDSRIDRYDKKHFSYVLSKAFEGHCCKCDQVMGQLEFDHF